MGLTHIIEYVGTPRKKYTCRMKCKINYGMNKTVLT